MKKLLTCLKLLALLFVTSYASQAQTGSLQATATGTDQSNPTATVIVGDITGGQPATSLTLTTNNSAGNCTNWYYYDMYIDASLELEDFCNVTDLDLSTLVTDVSGVVLVSVIGEDNPADDVGDNITVDMTLTAGWLGVDTDIVTYGLLDAGSEVGPAVIDDVNHTVVIDVANSYDETTSVNVFTVSPGATVSIAGVDQESGVTANDFTTPVTYTVTSASGNVQDWEVTMNVAETASSEKDMLTFNIAGFDGVIGANTIDVALTDPFLGLDLTALIPTFTSSDFSSVTISAVDQESGVTENDYSSTVVYTVTAEDGTTKDYIITVTLSTVCGAQINVDLAATTNEVDQTYAIVPPLGETVTITLSNWNIDPGGWSDAVTIYDGPDASSPVIGATYIGGEANPGTISSTSPTGALTIFMDVGTASNNGTTFTADITCDPASSENDFVSFSIPEELGLATIDTDAHTVDVEVNFGTDPSALTPSFESSTASTVSIAGVDQVSGGTENSYAGPVTYTITAQDGTTQDWIVSVTVAASLSDANDMVTFSFDGFDAVIGVGTVDLTVGAFTTDVTALNPTFTSSPFSTVAVGGVDQTSGTSTNDFTTPVTYTVTAQDGSTQDWVVTVTIPSMCGETLAYDADILGNGVDETFLLVPDAGQIITIDFTAWGPDFNSWGDIVTIYDGPNTSAPLLGTYIGGEPNPGPITSTSFDGTITIDVDLGSTNSQTFFTADITCTPASSENDFLSFTLPEGLSSGVIDTDAHTITVETAFGTDITALTPSFTSSIGSLVDIAGTDQESGVTTNNYSGPVTYTVTAQDGSTQDWTITVSVAAGASTANDFEVFTVNGADGVIDTDAHTVDVVIPAFDPTLIGLIPTFTSSPFSTVAIAGVDQVSGVDAVDFTTTVTYTITAQDDSTQDWVVTVTVGDPCGQTIVFDGAAVANETSETWIIVPAPGEVAQLTYTTWSIDPGGWGDIKNVYNGDSNASPLIATYDGGEANPGTITSTATNGALTIEFLVGFSPPNGGTQFTADVDCLPGSSENDFLTFSIPGEETGPAVIDTDAHTIDIEVGFGTDITALIPEFTTSEASTVNIAGVDQVSGVTENDYTTVVTYDVVAQDLTIQQWTVTVTNNPIAATGKDILTYSVAGVDATIGANTVDLDLDPFVNIADIIADFTLSPFATATISGVEQESGVTSNSFVVSTVTYTITAEDGTTKDYLVTITKEDICGYNLDYPLGAVNYQTFEDESWIIAPDTPGDIVTISFNAFGTETCCDHLFVYEGSDATGTFLFELDGTALPADISSSEGLFLNFTSDLSVQNIGFDLDITCETPNNDFLTFSLDDETAPATIDTDAHTIDIEVQLGTDPSLLTPTFTVSPFATVDIGGTDQESSVTENPYTSPVTYTVTAANGTTQDWVVTVTVAASLSDGSDFLAFNVNGSDGVIDTDAHTVDVEISPLDPDLTALVPTFTISPFATVAIAGVDQISGGTANDYTLAVTYTITAQDGSTQDWVVNVTVGSICGQSLVYDADVLGTGIDETFVFTPDPGQAVNVDFTAWGPDFNSWGDVVTIYDGPTTSSPVLGTYFGGEPNPSPIVSTSPEGSITIDVNLGSTNSQTFFTANITCTDALSGTDFLSYTSDVALDDAVIDTDNFTVIMEATFGTDVTGLINDFTLSEGASAAIGGVDQVSGTTSNDFTDPVIYTVTAQDGSTQDWTITVNVSDTASDAKDILTFSVAGVDGTIGDGTIDVVLGAFDSLGALTPSFTISPFSSITADGAPQITGFFTHDFTDPFTYVVTAQDGSTKDWVVTVTKPSSCDETLVYDADILGNGVDETFVFTPDPGTSITIDFTAWGPDFNSWGDIVTIYDGGTTSAPIIGTYIGGEANPGPLTSTALDGSITIDVDLGSTNSQTFFTAVVTCTTEDFALDLSVLLEGPYDSGVMGTGLRDGGHIPLLDPYSASSTLDAAFFDPGNNLTVVDWVEIEARQANTAAEADETTIVGTFNGLLLSDGSVVGQDGLSDMFLTGVTGDIYIVVNHRNHLSVMSSVAVSPVDGAYTYDFTSSVSQTYLDGSAEVDDVAGTAAMHLGDSNGDGTVKYVGANNDDIIIFNLIDGNTNLNNTEVGYFGSDVNLDGVAKYVGANNDSTPIFNKIDGNTNLNNTVSTTTP